jgi:hypothetical protein
MKKNKLALGFELKKKTLICSKSLFYQKKNLIRSEILYFRTWAISLHGWQFEGFSMLKKTFIICIKNSGTWLFTMVASKIIIATHVGNLLRGIVTW